MAMRAPAALCAPMSAKPEPADGEVRIRVEAASLNYRDLLILDRAGQSGLNGRVPLCDGAGSRRRHRLRRRAMASGRPRGRLVLSRLGLGAVQDQLCSVSPRQQHDGRNAGRVCRAAGHRAGRRAGAPHLGRSRDLALCRRDRLAWPGHTRRDGQRRHAAGPGNRRRRAVRPSVCRSARARARS